MNVHDYLRASDLYYYYFWCLITHHQNIAYQLGVCVKAQKFSSPEKIEGGKLLISFTIYYHSYVQYTWLHHLYLNRKVLA